MYCSDPTNEDGPEVSSLYGECIFSTYTEADMDLTLEVQAAAEAADFPARSALCLECRVSLVVTMGGRRVEAGR